MSLPGIPTQLTFLLVHESAHAVIAAHFFGPRVQSGMSCGEGAAYGLPTATRLVATGVYRIADDESEREALQSGVLVYKQPVLNPQRHRAQSLPGQQSAPHRGICQFEQLPLPAKNASLSTWRRAPPSECSLRTALARRR
jgi:hypothetical protein